MDVEQVLREIANKVVPKKITMHDVLSIPNYHATLQVQIWNGQLYTKTSVTEERHISILKQLRDVLLTYDLPNTVFAYCTQDHSPNTNCPLFTHALLANEPANKNIAAPCFTFDEYTADCSEKPMVYDEVRRSVQDTALPYMESESRWKTKEDTLVFVGSVNDDNDRSTNTRFTNSLDPVQLWIHNHNHTVNDKYVSREALAQYKYLLHLNGHQGAYASRLKYILMTGSLCFYIPQYKGSNKMWLEYWMMCPTILQSMVMARDVEDCTQKIHYYHEHGEDAYQVAKRGYDRIHTLLTKEHVLLYWKILLDTYYGRMVDPVKEQIYFIPCPKV
jgi:hypothetical protein